MARVNIDQKAFSDPRFTVLAKLLNLADADHALGKMARVWNECQERGTYVLDRVTIDAIFGIDGASKSVVTATLAEYRSNRVVRIKGTEGRIEWLQKRREDGKRGGRPSKTLGLTLGIDGKHPADNPPAPAPAPAPALPSGSSSLSPESVPVLGGSLAASRKRAAPACPYGAAFQVFAESSWQERHGAKPPWAREHGVALRTVAPQLGTLDNAKAAWRTFLDCREPWAIDHDPKVFKQRIGRFVGTPPQVESRFTKPTPGSCLNCRSDVAPGLQFCNGDCRKTYENKRPA